MGNTFLQVSNSFFFFFLFENIQDIVSLSSDLHCFQQCQPQLRSFSLVCSSMQRLPMASVRCGVLCIGGGALYDIPWCTLFPMSCIWGCLYPLKLWLHGLQNI